MKTTISFGVNVIPDLFTADTGKVFRGLTVTLKHGDWNVIVRAFDEKGVAIYAMQTGESLAECVEALQALLISRDAAYFWRFDGWYKDEREIKDS